MFTSENVRALFKKATLKLIPDGDGGLHRVCEATLVIDPFFSSFARELGEDIAGHLFTEDDHIRPELEAIDLSIRCGLQNVTVRHDPKMKEDVVIKGAGIRVVKVTRLEDEKSGKRWLAMTFSVVIILDSQAVRRFVIDGFGNDLYWTFRAMQGDMLEAAKPEPVTA